MQNFYVYFFKNLPMKNGPLLVCLWPNKDSHTYRLFRLNKILIQKLTNQAIYSLLLAKLFWAFTTDHKLCHTLTTMFVWVSTYSTYHMKKCLNWKTVTWNDAHQAWWTRQIGRNYCGVVKQTCDKSSENEFTTCRIKTHTTGPTSLSGPASTMHIIESDWLISSS